MKFINLMILLSVLAGINGCTRPTEYWTKEAVDLSDYDLCKYYVASYTTQNQRVGLENEIKKRNINCEGGIAVKAPQAPTETKNEAARVNYLKSIAQESSNLQPEKFSIYPSLFSLMEEIQMGTRTTADLNGGHYYFSDPIGFIDSGFQSSGTQFECIQVVDSSHLLPEEVEAGQTMHQGLYINHRLNINIDVVWFNNRPLVGQKLNVDYLIFHNVSSYQSAGAGQKSAIVFLRPVWAGNNGYIPPTMQ